MNNSLLYDLVALAEASYAKLQDPEVIGNANELIDRLTNADDFNGKFSNTQADDLASRWMVAAHQPNTETGFSATLFRNEDGKYVLAFRGTEPNFWEPIIDDLLVTDVGDIVYDGLAIKQIVDMYNFVQWLSTPTGDNCQVARLVPAPADPLILAYRASLASTNPAGRAQASLLLEALKERTDIVVDGDDIYCVELVSSEQVYATGDKYRQGGGQLTDGELVGVTGHSLGGHLATAFTRLFPNLGEALSINGAGYPTGITPGLGGMAETNIRNLFFSLGGADSFDPERITNIYGEKGLEFVTMNQHWGLEQPGSHLPVYIEDNIGHALGHGGEQMTDALAVYDLFFQLDESLRVADTKTALEHLYPLFAAASSAESTYETLVNQLGELFGTNVTISSINERGPLFDGIAALERSSGFLEATKNANLNVQALAGRASEEIERLARTDIAYRYALLHLNSFVVLGDAGLYASHNTQGELAFVDDAFSRSGTMTERYLQDRSKMLGLLIGFRSADVAPAGDTYFALRDTGERYYYEDRVSGRKIRIGETVDLALPPTDFRQTVFGSNSDDDDLSGGQTSDRLYGGGGDDTLSGNKGVDYLEGGRGYDTYLYKTGDGFNTIYDIDGEGRILFDGIQVKAGNRSAEGMWASDDGLHTLTLEGDLHAGGTLLIDDSIRIEGFHNGDLGFQLPEPVPVPPTDHVLQAGTSEYSFAFPVNDSLWFGDLVPIASDTLPYTDSILVLGDESNNYLGAAQGHDNVYGWGGNDWIYTYQGKDIVSGGSGNDVIFTAWDEDEVQAGDGDDVVIDNEYWDIGSSAIADIDEVVWSDVGWRSYVDVSSDVYFDADSQELAFHYTVRPADPPLTGTSVLGGQAYSYGIASDGYLAITYEQLGTVTVTTQRYDSQDDKGNRFSGGTGNDLLIGNQGADTLMGEADDDKLAGNEGDDVLIGGDGLDILLGGQGDDYLDGGAENDRIFGGSGRDEIFGGDGNDELAGDTNDDAIGSNDRISGGSGDDTLWGQGGDDRLDGGDGKDTLVGGAGRDELIGDSGEDRLFGGEGDDLLQGGADADVLVGDTGRDLLFGGEGTDELQGGAGDDLIAGDRGQDRLFGESGDDTYLFDVGDGADTLSDTAGANRIRFGLGVDTSGIDLYRFSDGGLVLNYGEGDAIQLDAGSAASLAAVDFSDGTSLSLTQLTAERMVTAVNLGGSAGADRLQGGLGDDRLYGYDGDDLLSGSGGADELNGHGGNDTLLGGGGDDRLHGDEGNDQLSGGPGADTLDGGSGGDTYVFAVGDGEDTILEYNDVTGETDVLRFGEGIEAADVAYARLANGDLIVQLGTAGDSLCVSGWFNGGGKIERFELADGTVLDTGFLATLPITPVEGTEAPDTLTGTQYADHLIGYGGDDLFDGLEGDDRLVGGSGNDVYVLGFDSGRDRLIDTEGTNRIRLDRGLLASDLVRWREGDDLRLCVDGLPQVGVDLQDYYAASQSWELISETGEVVPLEAVTVASGWATATDPLAAAEAEYLKGLEATFARDRITAGYQQQADGSFLRTPVAALYETRTTTTRQTTFDPASGNVSNTTHTSVSGPNLRQVTYASGVKASASRLSSGVSLLRIDEVEVTENLLNAGTDFWDSHGSSTTAIGFEAQQPHLSVLPTDGVSTAQYTGGSYRLSTLSTDTSVQETRGTLGDSGTPVTLYRSESDLVVERLQGDGSNNRITTLRGDQTVLDGGAGNDYLALGRHSAFHVGGFLAGGSGSDQLLGAHLDDRLAGGADSDLLDGKEGSDRYLIDTTDAGIDLIDDEWAMAVSGETGWSAYKAWYYANQGINAQESQVFEGPSLPTVPMADPTDFALVKRLAQDGVIDTDSLELSAGVDSQDLTVTWGFHDKDTLHATLNVSWGDGRGARIVMPIAAAGSNSVAGESPNEGGGLTPWVQANWFEVEAGLGAGIEELRLADGTVLSIGDLAAMAGPGVLNPAEGLVQSNGTEAPDTLVAETAGGYLSGGAGDDSLRGGASADVLVGGSGNDYLIGGLGSDLYRYHLGDGADQIIEDSSRPGELDVIQLGENLQPDATEVLRSGDDLVLRFGAADQQLRVTDWYADPDNRIEQVLFDEGCAWSADELETKAVWVNQEPVLNGSLPTVYLAEGGVLDYRLPAGLFDDPDVGDSLALSADLADGVPLPEWLSFDATSGEFTGSPDTGTAGQYAVRITAMDNQGASVATELAVQVLAEGDRIVGGAGDDSLWGSSRGDVLDGKAGADVLRGGGGDDRYYVDDANDIVIEEAGQGFDSIYSSLDWTLDAHQERLVLIGREALNGTGSANDDRLIGNRSSNRLEGLDGDDLLNGRGGGDTLVGGSGDDVYIVHGRDDVVIENAGQGYDTVRSSVTWRLGENLERLVLLGNAPINGTGTRSDDTLVGNSGANTLRGRKGNDVLNGGRGADRMIGGPGDDTYLFARGDGADKWKERGAPVDTGDRAVFGQDIAHDQLWFERHGNHLDLSVIGTHDSVRLLGWFADPSARIERFDAGDGQVLFEDQVQRLVDAMASFQAPGVGETTLSPDLQEQLAPALAAAWQAVGT